MRTPEHRPLVIRTLSLLALLAAPSALAVEINGFTVTAISPSDALSRFGDSLDDPYALSLSDCRYFLGLTAEACTSGTTDSTDADVVSSGDTTTSVDTVETRADTAADEEDTTTAVDDDAQDSDAETPVDDVESAVEDAASEDDATTTDEDAAATAEDASADGDTGAAAPGKADTGASAEFKITFKAADGSATLVDAVYPVYTEMAYAIGTNCSESAVPTDGDDCDLVQSMKSQTDWASITISFTYSQLFGSDCTDSADRKIYVYAKTEKGAIEVSTLTFDFDYTPPGHPTTDEPTAGEENITVSWTDTDTDKDLTHRVYWSATAFTSADIAAGASGIDSSKEVTASSYQITGITNGTTYYIGVVAIDPSGNESEICDTSTLQTATPIPLDDFYEYYKRNGGKEEGGFSFCFVATAAWGSPVAPPINWLRSFRDTVMMSSTGGQALVALYEKVGPAAANVIRDNAGLRGIARVLLWPLVGVATALLFMPAWGPLALGLAAALGLRLRRRRGTPQ